MDPVAGSSPAFSPGSPGAATFLWGPRQAAESALLRQCYPDSRWVDLLKSDEFRRYLTNPEYPGRKSTRRDWTGTARS